MVAVCAVGSAIIRGGSKLNTRCMPPRIGIEPFGVSGRGGACTPKSQSWVGERFGVRLYTLKPVLEALGTAWRGGGVAFPFPRD